MRVQDSLHGLTNCQVSSRIDGDHFSSGPSQRLSDVTNAGLSTHVDDLKVLLAEQVSSYFGRFKLRSWPFLNFNIINQFFQVSRPLKIESLTDLILSWDHSLLGCSYLAFPCTCCISRNVLPIKNRDINCLLTINGSRREQFMLERIREIKLENMHATRNIFLISKHLNLHSK